METITKHHWKQLHDNTYLGAYSLMNDSGQYGEIVIKLKSVQKKPVKGEDGKEADVIVAEVHNQKPIILNSTNCKMLTKLFNTPIVEDWLNKPVSLCVKKIKAFGDTVDALRISNVLPTPPALPELNEAHEKWEGARKAILAGNTTIEKIKKSFTLSPEMEQKLTAA